MTVGDAEDMGTRLRSALPGRWFSDQSPVLDGVLAGIGAIWATIYLQLSSVVAQTRLATASGAFLEMAATDMFGRRVSRRLTEEDAPFRSRIQREILRERGTRGAIIGAVRDLTGRAPRVFEPARPADTGSWGGAAGSGSMGYGLAGRWGSLALPYQCFVFATRPVGQGIGVLSGWGDDGGGYGVGDIAWSNAGAISGQLSDQDIAATIAEAMPVGSIAWVSIGN